MRISASIYANKKESLKSYVEKLDRLGVDMFHVDFNDSKMNFNDLIRDVELIRLNSEKPIDLHIISPAPSKYFDFIQKYEIEYTCFQYEYIAEEIILPNFTVTMFGLSLTIDTPVEIYINNSIPFKYISFMTSTPGESGSNFNLGNLERIKNFRNQKPNHLIQVDGGLNHVVINSMRSFNLDMVVLGAMLSRSQNLMETICSI